MPPSAQGGLNEMESHHQVVCDLDQSTLSAVGGPETRLELLIEVVEFKMVLTPFSNHAAE